MGLGQSKIIDMTVKLNPDESDRRPSGRRGSSRPSSMTNATTTRTSSATNSTDQVIIFDVSKAASKSSGPGGTESHFTPSEGYRSWTRRLKTSGWKVVVNKDPLSPELLSQGRVLVISRPSTRFSEVETSHLVRFVEGGGGLLILTGEGGEPSTTLMDLAGIETSQDCVLRTSYYKNYYHPKEALITGGIVNRALLPLIKRLKSSTVMEDSKDSKMSGTPSTTGDQEFLPHLYPYGCTLSTKISISSVILSTGAFCIPVQRPTVVLTRRGKGVIVTIGSSHVFHDSFIQKEDNFILMETTLYLLTNPSFGLNPIDSENPDILDYTYLPDLEHLSDQPISCLEEGESVPEFTKLFSREVFELTNVTVVQVHQAIEAMGMEREPLKLIKPAFETPLPPLEPAVFPPIFRAPEKPMLELFDLDEAFSSTSVKLAQVASKCGEGDLNYYVRECGVILGVEGAVKKSAKEILHTILSKVVEYKKVGLIEEDE